MSFFPISHPRTRSNPPTARFPEHDGRVSERGAACGSRRNTLAQRSEPVVRKPANASVRQRIPALQRRATPVEQGAVQRGAGVGVHTELPVFCEKSRGCSARSLRHPQHFVHVVVMVRTRASKYNENVVDLLKCHQRAGPATSSPPPATSVIPRPRLPPRPQTRDPLARQRRTRRRMMSLWR